MTLRATPGSLALPHMPRAAAGRSAAAFWSCLARRQMRDPSALIEDDTGEMAYPAGQPTRQAAVTDCDQ
jgi:hypothetical protein